MEGEVDFSKLGSGWGDNFFLDCNPLMMIIPTSRVGFDGVLDGANQVVCIDDHLDFKVGENRICGFSKLIGLASRGEKYVM